MLCFVLFAKYVKRIISEKFQVKINFLIIDEKNFFSLKNFQQNENFMKANRIYKRKQIINKVIYTN